MGELGTRVTLLCNAFEDVFHPRQPRPFNNAQLRASGTCDGAEGVQWNAWINHDTLAPYLGVNLEGIEYAGWPVARVIQRELADPRLLQVRDTLPAQDRVEVVVGREVWQAGSRLGVPENAIGGTPALLRSLTLDQWLQALREADDCLEGMRFGYKHATQFVTLKNGSRVEREVSPQLQFRLELSHWRSYPPALRALVQEAREQLNWLHDFLSERSATQSDGGRVLALGV